MVLNLSQTDVLKDFCALILCGHQEKAFRRCKECVEKAVNEYGGIPDILNVLSGNDVDPDDPFGNMASDDKQSVKPQYYLISTDAGAPDLEDFFGFVEDLKTARGLDFNIDEEKFSDDDCIVKWLAELAAQLEDLYIVDFDGASEDYHFTIMNKDDCERAMDLFQKMTAHIDSYTFKSFVITSDFQG